MAKASKPARARFAPSPTGRLHIGGARTALYDYLLARQTGGQFILRIEDTDRRRYQPESEQEIMDGLRWLGLEWDEGPDIGGPHGPYRQSDRKEIYQKFARQLIDSGHAFRCFCTPKRLEEVRQLKNKLNPRYDGTCRNLPRDEVKARIDAGESHVIRFKMPFEGNITVTDALRGDITVENRNLDDYIIVKSDGLPVYHLAVVVDDHLMKITHVVRGSEWISTFPLHGHIYRALRWEEPLWIHLSVFLKPSGKGKMSKRGSTELMKDGKSIFVTNLEAMDYLPEAVINWIALIGWSYDDRTEFFMLDELIEKFSIEKLNPSPARINFTKFDHFNGLHIRNLSIDELAMRTKPLFEAAGYHVSDEILTQIAPIIQVRLRTLDEAPKIAGFFFKVDVTPVQEELVAKNTTAAESTLAARRAYEILSSLPVINHETAEQPLRDLADDLGLKAGQLFGILRVAVTGQRVSPPLFETIEIVGREKVLRRIKTAIETLEELS